MPATDFSHTDLAQALLAAVRAQPWAEARDARRGGLPFTHNPSLDLAVAVLPRQGAPVFANVLFSREWPDGHVAAIAPDAGPVQGVQWLMDCVDAQGVSLAWQPDADWSRLAFAPLAGSGPRRFVVPYAASLIKLMVAVGVGRLVDAGRTDWDEPWAHAGQTHSLADWCEPMITLSSNGATDALVALLHARGLIRRGPQGETSNLLHEAFVEQGLSTLRLADTRADGGWRGADGCGVGHLHMTAWDTVRLLWRTLDASAPWLPAHTPVLLSTPSRQRLWRWLAAQQLNQVLSSKSLLQEPGWRAGIASGFAHKTGNTETYASDAGLFFPHPEHRVLIALLSTLGQCSAPTPACATHWCVPALGAAIEAWLQERLS